MRRITVLLAATAFLASLVVQPASATEQTATYIGNADFAGICPGDEDLAPIGSPGIGRGCFNVGNAPSVEIEVLDEVFVHASYLLQWNLTTTDITGDQNAVSVEGCGKTTFARPADATGSIDVWVDGPVYRAINTACIDPANPTKAVENGIGTSGTIKINF